VAGSQKPIASIAAVRPLQPARAAEAAGVEAAGVGFAVPLENCTGGFVREAGKLVFAIGFTTTLTVNAVERQQTPQLR
jgi:hypothetical protein